MRDSALNQNSGGWSALRSSTEVDTRRKKLLPERQGGKKRQEQKKGTKEMSAKTTLSLNSNSFHISKSQKEVFPNKRPLRAVKPMA